MINCLFVHCDCSYSLWCRLLARCGGANRSMEGFFFFGSSLILWRLIPFAIFWSVWKERNNRIFRGSLLTVEDLSQIVVVQVAKWASFKKEFDTLNGVMRDREASLYCGKKKMKKVVHWIPPNEYFLTTIRRMNITKSHTQHMFMLRLAFQTSL